MASCFFLLRQFEDVLIYLKSIKQYLATDDDFNWNYGIACASNGEWAEAEEAFGAVQGAGYRQEGAFLNWSARTFIKQGKRRRGRGDLQPCLCSRLSYLSITCYCHDQQEAPQVIKQLQTRLTML